MCIQRLPNTTGRLWTIYFIIPIAFANFFFVEAVLCRNGEKKVKEFSYSNTWLHLLLYGHNDAQLLFQLLGFETYTKQTDTKNQMVCFFSFCLIFNTEYQIRYDCDCDRLSPSFVVRVHLTLSERICLYACAKLHCNVCFFLLPVKMIVVLLQFRRYFCAHTPILFTPNGKTHT